MRTKQNKDRHQHQSEGFRSSTALKSSYFCVEDVNGEPPARDPKNGCIVEEMREAFSVQSGAGNQHLQISSEPGDVFNETKEDVGVERPLVGLIDDDHTKNTRRGSGNVQKRVLRVDGCAPPDTHISATSQFPADLKHAFAVLPVAGQVRLSEELSEQHTVRHVLQHRSF